MKTNQLNITVKIELGELLLRGYLSIVITILKQYQEISLKMDLKMVNIR